MTTKEYNEREVFVLFEISKQLNWKIEAKKASISVKYIFYTPIGNIRVTQWDHNGEYNINLIDDLFKLPKLRSYIKGFVDSDRR